MLFSPVVNFPYYLDTNKKLFTGDPPMPLQQLHFVGGSVRPLQIISTGHFGSARKNARPYGFVTIRLSKITMMPRSVCVRIRRPTPCRSFRMASGNEYSVKGSPPRSCSPLKAHSVSAFDGPVLSATGHAEVLVRPAPSKPNILNLPSR